MKQRLAPFLALLDARYLPLLFAAAPQAYVVYQWLWHGSDHSVEALIFAIAGALGYEFVYVGAIAWAEGQAQGEWVWATALCALVFSVAVAIYVHIGQGYWALLHAGFPIVAFAYTMTIHTSLKPIPAVQYARNDVPPQPVYKAPKRIVEDAANADGECIDASRTCPNCGAPLDEPRWRAARRWKHCANCKEA